MIKPSRFPANLGESTGSPPFFMSINNSLFEKNFQIFTSSNPHLINGVDFDISVASKKRDESDFKLELKNWGETLQESTVKYPNQMLRHKDLADDLENRYSHFKVGGDISQYYDQPAYDPHLVHLLLDLRKAVLDTGFDIEDQARYLVPPHNTLICFGTGDGQALSMLLESTKPHNLYIVVENDWNDYISSFWNIDWLKVWDEFAKSSKNNNYSLFKFIRA